MPSENKAQLLRLLKRIEEHLHSLQTIIEKRHKDEEASPKYQQTDSGEMKPLVSSAEKSEAPETLSGPPEANKDQGNWTKWFFMVDCGTLLALVATLIFVALQWHSMYATLDEMKVIAVQDRPITPDA